MAYSELIKNFDRIRDYMRQFYVYGFKSRTEYDKKSARSYDNERRRLESWLGDCMRFRQTSDGKNVFLSVDSRSIPGNPLYNAFKAKSFTAGDVTFHFYILDILRSGTECTVHQILDLLYEKYLCHFEDTWHPDISTIRKKLKEYVSLTKRIVPGMVGVDIGCGMETVRVAQREIDFAKLDRLIRSQIPCGREIRNTPHPLNDQIDLTKLRCSPYVNLSRAQRSIGTLGGGNHFIEVDRGEKGDLFIVVHSGSRHIGNEVAKYYQNEGRKAFWGGARHQVDAAVAELKAQGRFREIQPAINRLRKEREISLPRDLAYVEGKLFEDYLHDMKIIQHFATLNRKAMMDVILSGMNLTPVEQFTTIHNYIDTDNRILRKGAVAAYAGQKLLIPINMRDGSLICIGKGNPDWNCSAPHGAGRIMSRKEAFNRLSLDEYRKEMEGIYTTCVDRTTLDEAPMAYKGIDEILSNISPTVNVVERIIPVYNFKAAE